MANWDVFHSERLEVERGLPAEEIQARRARGELHDDDLVRPAGTTLPWKSLIDTPAFASMPAAPPAPAPVLPTPLPTPPSKSEPELSPHSTDDLPPPSPYGFGFDDTPTFIQPREYPPGPSNDETPLNAEEESQASRMSRFGPLDDPPTDFKERQEFVSDPFGVALPPGSTDKVSIADFLFDDVPDKNDAAMTWAQVEDDDAPQELPTIVAPADFGPRFSAQPEPDPGLRPGAHELIADALIDDEDEPDEDVYDPQEEDEEAAEFTLSRSAPETVEELDLAAMVDVAFQLVLFFLVTATTVLYKSLEVPRPADEKPPEAAVQGRGRSLDDLSKDFVLVEIDSAGNYKIDREAVTGDLNAIISRLRTARETTGRHSMLLSPDYNTPHRLAVVACDAANEIGMDIKFANPKRPDPK